MLAHAKFYKFFKIFDFTVQVFKELFLRLIGISLIEGSTKSGGGTQGREVKMKSTKKKYMKGKGDQGGDSDEEEVSKSRGAEIQFMSVEEMVEELKQQPELRDCPQDFITEIATQIHRWGTI